MAAVRFGDNLYKNLKNIIANLISFPLKELIRKHFPLLFVVVFLCVKLLVILKLLRVSNRFYYKDLLRFKEKKQEVVILGSGQTINELTESDYAAISERVSIALGRWIYKDFVPDIYILEANESEKMIIWLKDFCNLLLKRMSDYKNTIIIIDGAKGSKKIRNIVDEMLPVSIRKNIRFSITLKSPSGSTEVFSTFLRIILKSRIYRFYNVLLHCRSSTVMATLLGLYFRPNKIILAGVDGYAGYFASSDNARFHGDYGGLDKNYNYSLHSTANPEFGLPTVTDCIRVISEDVVPCEVTSEHTVLSKYLLICSFDQK